jgi:hypothetical protein
VTEDHGLAVRVGNDELNAIKAKINHAIHCIATPSSHTHDLDNGCIGGFFSPVSESIIYKALIKHKLISLPSGPYKTGNIEMILDCS